jgi:hypothetical protein
MADAVLISGFQTIGRVSEGYETLRVDLTCTTIKSTWNPRTLIHPMKSFHTRSVSDPGLEVMCEFNVINPTNVIIIIIVCRCCVIYKKKLL